MRKSLSLFIHLFYDGDIREDRNSKYIRKSKLGWYDGFFMRLHNERCSVCMMYQTQHSKLAKSILICFSFVPTITKPGLVEIFTTHFLCVRSNFITHTQQVFVKKQTAWFSCALLKKYSTNQGGSDKQTCNSSYIHDRQQRRGRDGGITWLLCFQPIYQPDNLCSYWLETTSPSPWGQHPL